MKVFADANILVSVLNKEYPVFTYASRILSLAGSSHTQIVTSPICLAIAWYFAEKKSGAKAARDKMKTLCSHLVIAPATSEAVQRTINNKKINDFEDGLEYYSALEIGCQIIVTEDVTDFYFSDLSVYTARDFYEQKLINRN